MFAPRDYLLVEWANVKRTLQETLRFRYSESHIALFYAECLTRLKYIKEALEGTGDDEQEDLRGIAIELDGLSSLIARVERSHLEEFSWPFGDALARVAKEVCKETTQKTGPLAEVQPEPLFFFAAQGGISSYAVRPEKHEPGAIDRKVYSVVFPRSLKDQVLLHAILAHEWARARKTDPGLHLKVTH